MDESNKGKRKVKGNNIMMNLGLAYFMPYDSFTYHELLYAIALRISLQGFVVRAIKEKKKEKDKLKY